MGNLSQGQVGGRLPHEYQLAGTGRAWTLTFIQRSNRIKNICNDQPLRVWCCHTRKRREAVGSAALPTTLVVADHKHAPFFVKECQLASTAVDLGSASFGNFRRSDVAARCHRCTCSVPVSGFYDEEICSCTCGVPASSAAPEPFLSTAPSVGLLRSTNKSTCLFLLHRSSAPAFILLFPSPVDELLGGTHSRTAGVCSTSCSVRRRPERWREADSA